MVFLLIQTEGPARASSILSAAGATFVVPFLLFSTTAGILADRFSKQRLLMIMKAAEIGIMFLALFAFAFQSSWASFLLLFLLATHSAAFAPSKYAIIPEVVPKEKVSRANGLITSFTYLAIILGTFLASFLTEITDRNFVLVVTCCLLIAIIGFLSTFGIKKTPAQGSDKKLNLLILQDVFRTLKICGQRKYLLVTIFSAAFFLFVGAFTQLNIIPFGMQSLDLSAADGGYLFLSTAIGIALGSFIAGKLSKKQVEPGISCLAGLGMGVIFLLLDLFSSYLVVVVILLMFLGICGGLFIVPLDSFNQINSMDEKRGQVMALVNFLSFIGVLLASFALYLFSQLLGLSSAHGFALTGLITLAVSAIMIIRLSDLFFSFMGRKVFRKIYKTEIENIELFQKTKHPVLVLQGATWGKAFRLLGLFPNLKLLVLKPQGKKVWFEKLFPAIHLVPNENSYEELFVKADEYREENKIPCFLIEEEFPKTAYFPESKEYPELIGVKMKVKITFFQL